MTDKLPVRELPEFMRFVLLRVGGKPIYMYLWYIWVLTFFVLIYRFAADENALNAADRFRFVMYVGVLALAVNVGLLMKDLASKTARKRLFVRVGHEGITPSLMSCAIIRATPIVALIVFVQVCILGV